MQQEFSSGSCACPSRAHRRRPRLRVHAETRRDRQTKHSASDRSVTRDTQEPLQQCSQAKRAIASSPSHARKMKVSPGCSVSLRTSGMAVTICSPGPSSLVCLYSKSPMARERLRLPLTRPSATKPPACTTGTQRPATRLFLVTCRHTFKTERLIHSHIRGRGRTHSSVSH